MLKKHGADFENLVHYILNNNLDDAYRLIHTLKSLVKTIGMNDIHLGIIDIENSIINKESISSYIDEIYTIKERFETKIYIMNYVRNMIDENLEVKNEI